MDIDWRDAVAKMRRDNIHLLVVQVLLQEIIARFIFKRTPSSTGATRQIIVSYVVVRLRHCGDAIELNWCREKRIDQIIITIDINYYYYINY